MKWNRKSVLCITPIRNKSILYNEIYYENHVFCQARNILVCVTSGSREGAFHPNGRGHMMFYVPNAKFPLSFFRSQFILSKILIAIWQKNMQKIWIILQPSTLSMLFKVSGPATVRYPSFCSTTFHSMYMWRIIHCDLVRNTMHYFQYTHPTFKASWF